jgi:hypothetical protein
MDWFPAFKEVLSVVVYVALVSVFWKRFNASPRESAEKNTRSGALLGWFLAFSIVTAAMLLFCFDRENFIEQFGATNILVSVTLAVGMGIGGVGLWLRKRWGIVFNLFLAPVLLSFVVSSIGIKPGEFVAIMFLLLASIFFVVDMRSLWEHWNE